MDLGGALLEGLILLVRFCDGFGVCFLVWWAIVLDFACFFVDVYGCFEFG